MDLVVIVLTFIIIVLIVSWWTSGSTGSTSTSTSSPPGLDFSKTGTVVHRECSSPGGVPGRLFNSLIAPSDFPVKPITAVVPPDTFDTWRQQNLLLPIRDQRGCGSCWAFSAIGVLGQRISIATQGQHKIPLSAQFLVSCDANAAGCDGAESLHTVFGSLTYNGTGLGIPGGTVAETVYPYEEPADNANTLPCRKELVQNATIYDFVDDSVVCLSESDDTGAMTPTQLQQNILRMKQEIMNGPISACYAVYDDFMSWNGQGVYQVSSSSSNQLQGYHAVIIVGWGVSGLGMPNTPAGVPYWICQNSWGSGWGQAGYWYHKIGDNMTFIESNCHAATPKLDNLEIVRVLNSLNGRQLDMVPSSRYV